MNPMPERKLRTKRNRATALVLNGGRLLLVRERGAKHWSLPGGGVKKSEDPVAAAIRELAEETKLVAVTATYLFHYESPSQHHHVCRLEVEGKVELLKEEIGDYRWWDGETELAIIPSAMEIIGRVKRHRATAMVFREGRLLLVRERGAKHWSLPGGGMKKGEDAVAAAIRELDEETKLVATSATYLFHYESPSQNHHVCLLEVEGEVELLREEIGDYRWWDGETQLAIIPSAREIIGRVMDKGPLCSVLI